MKAKFFTFSLIGLLCVEDITVGHRLMMHQVQVHGGEDIQYPLEDMNDVKKIINRRFAKRVRAGVTAPQKTRDGQKNPTQKNPPKKTQSKKPTKNGFFWVFLKTAPKSFKKRLKTN